MHSELGGNDVLTRCRGRKRFLVRRPGAQPVPAACAKHKAPASAFSANATHRE